jgi:hypothetical protein
VSITGTNLFSGNGQVVVYFGATFASTSCSSQTVCTATVPGLGAPGTVSVTVHTDAGTSNGVPFAFK